MGKPKSILKKSYIDQAKAQHKCRRNKDHVIAKGLWRLNIKEGRSIQRYCLSCGKVSVENDMKFLDDILTKMKSFID